MKYQISEEEFREYLNAFTMHNEPRMIAAVNLLTSGALWNMCSEVSEIAKRSLVRKVLRYVANTALRGTFEIDGLSVSANFCKMEHGYPVSFGDKYEWTFWSRREGTQVKVVFDPAINWVWYDWMCRETDKPRQLSIKWSNLGNSPTTIEGKVDVISHFEDPRTDLDKSDRMLDD